MDAARTPKPLMDYRPVWSPDGRRLAFTRNLSGSATLGKTPQQIERQFHANPRRTMIVRASGGRPHELRRSASLIDWR
jgi:hypothetical protein